MKICPKCHTQYDDSMNFCVKDGVQLVTQGTESTIKSDLNDISVKKKRTGNGCLKKILIALVAVVGGLVALYNYLTNAATYLRVEPNQLNAPKNGGECKIDVDYDGYVWVINHKPDWVNVDEYDSSFNVEVKPNISGDTREGSITIQSGKCLSQLVIKQNGRATYVRASDTQIHFGQYGSSESVTIESDGCYWTAEYSDWMEVEKISDSTLRVDCSRNDRDYRTGTIKVFEDGAYVTIYVTQGGKCNICHGKGEVSCGFCSGTGGFGLGMFYNSCMGCGGSGKFQCSACGGSGYKE